MDINITTLFLTTSLTSEFAMKWMMQRKRISFHRIISNRVSIDIGKRFHIFYFSPAIRRKDDNR